MATHHDTQLTTHQLISHMKDSIDITKPPFNAAGDGVTDDAAAIQAAVNAAQQGVVRFASDESAHSANDCPNEDSAAAGDESKSD